MAEPPPLPAPGSIKKSPRSRSAQAIEMSEVRPRGLEAAGILEVGDAGRRTPPRTREEQNAREKQEEEEGGEDGIPVATVIDLGEIQPALGGGWQRARQELGMVKPNEILVQIATAEAKLQAAEAAEAARLKAEEEEAAAQAKKEQEERERQDGGSGGRPPSSSSARAASRGW